LDEAFLGTRWKQKGLSLHCLQKRAEALHGLARIGEQLKVLDLTELTIRQAISDAKDAKSLYETHGLVFRL
jgi:hypothetical protein